MKHCGVYLPEYCLCPKVVGKKQIASAETPTWQHRMETGICKYFKVTVVHLPT